MNPYLTFCIACYAAFVSTLVLAWDITKWKRLRPRLNVEVRPNTKVAYTSNVAGHSTRFAEICTCISVTNVGAHTTTIKDIMITQCPISEAEANDVVHLSFNTLGDKLPFALEAGKQWQGYLNEQNGNPLRPPKPNTYVHVYHSMSDEPTSARLNTLG
jgi:hypothetical protein